MRDYGIDLVEQIDVISWRKFAALFRNLSPYGATAARIEEMKRKPKEDQTEEEGRSQAAAFFASVLSTNGSRN
ncbi:MAG: bacteriophage Gp15 family protein [Clostridiales bacterium]|nr:bacteriophage Gp15 family protein [Clostridiales bacterium]